MKSYIRNVSIFSLLLFGISYMLNSCCTEKMCIGAKDLDCITFYNFSSNDLDTMIIKEYMKGSNYSKVRDSLMITPQDIPLIPVEQIIRLPKKIDVACDYEITLSSGQTFRISDFETSKEKCNEGFLCFDYFIALKQYKVNNKVQKAGFLKIYNQ